MRKRNSKGHFIHDDGEKGLSAEEVDILDEFLSSPTATVKPIVEFLPPNNRLVMCTVGPHKRVRVMVRPNHQNYLPRMVIPMEVDLTNFDSTKLLIYNGNPPRRKGNW